MSDTDRAGGVPLLRPASPRPASPVRSPKAANWKLVALFAVIGVAAIVGALRWRHRVLTDPNYKLVKALEDPRAQKLQTQYARLQADVDAHPNDVNAHWRLAAFFRQIGLIDQAQVQLQAIAKLQPTDMLAQKGIAGVDLLTQKASAEAIYRDQIKKNPKDLAAWQGLAAALHLQGRYLEAIGAIDQALALNPTDQSSQFIKADAMLEYVAQFPTTQPYRKTALAAKQIFEKLEPVWPKEMLGQLEGRLGGVCVLLQDNKGAIAHMNQALVYQPTEPTIYLSLAQVQQGTGDRAAARHTVEDGIARCRPFAGLYDLQGQLIQSSGETGASDRSLAAFQKAVDLDSKESKGHPDYSFLEHLGTALIRVNKLVEAHDVFAQVAKLNPDRAFAYQQLAAIYTRLGDVKRANQAAVEATGMEHNDQQLKQVQLILQAHPENLALTVALANRYRDLHLRGAARDTYLSILRRDPKNKDALDAIASMNQEDRQMAASR